VLFEKTKKDEDEVLVNDYDLVISGLGIRVFPIGAVTSKLQTGALPARPIDLQKRSTADMESIVYEG